MSNESHHKGDFGCEGGGGGWQTYLNTFHRLFPDFCSIILQPTRIVDHLLQLQLMIGQEFSIFGGKYLQKQKKTDLLYNNYWTKWGKNRKNRFFFLYFQNNSSFYLEGRFYTPEKENQFKSQLFYIIRVKEDTEEDTKFQNSINRQIKDVSSVNVFTFTSNCGFFLGIFFLNFAGGSLTLLHSFESWTPT